MLLSHSVIAVHHLRRRKWVLHSFKSIYFILYSSCEIVLNPITAWGLSRADCGVSCLPGRPLITVVDFRGAGRAVGLASKCFVYTTTIELRQFKEMLETHTPGAFLHVGTRPWLRLWWFLVYSFVYRLSGKSVFYSLTKWNFNFLVCKWVSPSAFVWYLFIHFMWQEQCTLINISAFTSL